MSGTYNGNATVQQLADAVAMDPKLKGEIYARILETSAGQYNAFERMTSEMDPRTKAAGGVRSIFAKKGDLKAGGGDSVNFNVIGPPGGPGVKGSQELTGNTSKSQMATYKVRVGWHRDGFELTKDQVEFLSAGRSLEETTADLLAMKMGILRQNHMMMRLIKSVDGNIYRPNNRLTRAAILPTDKLSVSLAHSARARLRTIGGRPIKHRLGENGSPVDGYLMFASDMAMLPVRNDDGYQVALAQGHTRGDENANFSGDLIQWGGMPWFEQPTVDEAWDDYIGSPILPKAKLGTAFGAATASGACKLIVNSANTKSLYFQFFDGYDYLFEEDQTAAPDAAEYYAWIVNPDGSVGFVAYTGSGNNGNQITVTKILSKNGTGTSTKGAATVGELKVNASATPDEWTGGDGNLPTGWTYTDEFAAGAVIIQANAKGAQIGRSFVFGSMAACFASGRIDMSPIEQTRDFGFTIGRGYEMIFGTGVTTNPFKKPVGYLLMEHAIEHEGYATPVADFS